MVPSMACYISYAGHEDVGIFPALRHVDGASAVSHDQIRGIDEVPGRSMAQWRGDDGRMDD